VTELQQNRYDRLVRRVGNIVAPGAIVGDALNELFPTIDVENVPSELLVLMGTAIAFGGTTLAGVAGNISRVQLLNPVGSNVLITLTHCDVALVVDADVRYGINQISLADNTNDAVFRETRFGGPARPVGQLRTQSNLPTLAPTNGRIRLLANTTYRIDDPNDLAVLLPGFGWTISSNIQNSLITTTMYWRERVGEPAELNF
jgi:hypothetical protein